VDVIARVTSERIQARHVGPDTLISTLMMSVEVRTDVLMKWRLTAASVGFFGLKFVTLTTTRECHFSHKAIKFNGTVDRALQHAKRETGVMSFRFLYQTVVHPGSRQDLGDAPTPQYTAATLHGSLQIRHVDAGSCNGCELEVTSAFAPVYDAERFG